jgi:hypothetical protein
MSRNIDKEKAIISDGLSILWQNDQKDQPALLVLEVIASTKVLCRY